MGGEEGPEDFRPQRHRETDRGQRAYQTHPITGDEYEDQKEEVLDQ